MENKICQKQNDVVLLLFRKGDQVSENHKILEDAANDRKIKKTTEGEIHLDLSTQAATESFNGMTDWCARD
ncbi:hypothetical protein MKW98_019986 [Papaver atlanticum]|uniref:Uncharacterized protein n=1 Tax=Papaver atlanticum TaxID=357466 RepID=A0AAD4X7D7_9MAGN|nr:hypothetical protein MKW98_019986 [Papaver atlanticum]